MSTLLRGSYISRTGTRELEFTTGAAVYHPRAYQHHDEIGSDGGVFFGVQLNPALFLGADHSRSDNGRDVAILKDTEDYIILGALYAALCGGADQLVFDSLAYELAGRQMASKRPPLGPAPPWLRRTKERVRDELHVSLKELSLEAGVHATTLTRLFRQQSNCSIGEYQARTRAQRAFFAIVGSRVPLSEICQEVGYADQSHMTRALRRAFGATPGQLRRTILSA